MLGKVVQLVLVLQATNLHGLLVQGCETNGVHRTGQRGVHTGVEHPQHAAPTGGTYLAHGDVGLGNAVHRHKSWACGAGAVAGVCQRGDGVGSHHHTGHLLAPGPEPGVANQHHVGLLRGLGA